MLRRDFITLAGGAAAWPLAPRAQLALPVIGYLGGGSLGDDVFRLEAFRQRLKSVGYIEHQNVEIESRWAEGPYDRFPGLAAELVCQIASNHDPRFACKDGSDSLLMTFAGADRAACQSTVSSSRGMDCIKLPEARFVDLTKPRVDRLRSARCMS